MKKVFNGNEACAYISYAFTEIASLYPITPSTSMAEAVERWVALGKTNIYGAVPEAITMESENGSAGLIYGAAKSGALAVTYTCSQGLLLMIPTLYKLAGERLPVVIHNTSRTVATNALSIYGDHSDVMAARQTGVLMLASGNVQEVAIFATLAHKAALASRLPLLHFFDGFETSHELRDIQVPSYDRLKKVIPETDLAATRQQALSNFRPVASGTSQTPELFFQQRETVEAAYSDLPEKMESWLQEINQLYPGNHSLVEYIGAPDAKEILVVMGSAQETVKEVVNQQIQQHAKIGAIILHLYRPFPVELFLRRLPETVKKIMVMDRTKEPGSIGEPLLLDVQQACQNQQLLISGCRYGLGGKEVTPQQIEAIYLFLKNQETSRRVTVGITDDLMNSSLPLEESELPTIFSGEEFICLGTGNDGSITGFRGLAKVISQLTDKHVQCRFEHSPLKSGDLTKSSLRVSQEEIIKGYGVDKAHHILVNQINYLQRVDILSHLRPGANIILNFKGDEAQLQKMLPADLINGFLEKKINLYCVPAEKIGREYQLGIKLNCLMIAALLHILAGESAERWIYAYQKLFKTADFMSDPEYYQRTCAGMQEARESLQKVQLQPVFEGEATISEEKSPFEEKIRLPCYYRQSQKITTKILAELDLSAGNYPLPTSQKSNDCGTCHLRLQCSDTGCQRGPSLLQAAGACRGCGETPYMSLLTQLFGPRLAIANATGCSSIWGGSAPDVAYRKNAKGLGPVWANPLFENNSSFGRGLEVGQAWQRQQALAKLQQLILTDYQPLRIKVLAKKIIASKGFDVEIVQEFLQQTEESLDPNIQQLRQQSYALIKRSQWIVGGDGWAYDIDFGGIDHLLSSGQDVNILILDNSGYANTGGQLSKGTDLGVKAKLATNGSLRQKKQFAAYALQYDNVFVAEVSVMADSKQTETALLAAERHPGVSVVIAHSHCVLHKSEASGPQLARLATDSGYWPLFIRDPQKEIPFVWHSSPEVVEDKLRDFIKLQADYQPIRENSVLYQKFQKNIKKNLHHLQILARLDNEGWGWKD